MIQYTVQVLYRTSTVPSEMFSYKEGAVNQQNAPVMYENIFPGTYNYVQVPGEMFSCNA